MSIRKNAISILAFLIILVVTGCGKKDPDKEPLFIIDNDTISLGKAKECVFDSSMAVSQIGTAAARRLTLAQTELQTLDTADYSSVVKDLAERLSLETGEDWKAYPSRCLFLSGKALHKKADSLLYPQAVFASVDSLIKANVRFITKKSPVPVTVKDTALNNDSINIANDTRAFSKLLSSVLILPDRIAAIVNEFILTETISVDSMAGVADMIKGLLADRTSQPVKKRTKVVRQKRANSKMALKYRSQNSIKDSINKHIPNLKALYKKQLKTNESISGQIWVNFVVTPDGRVASAAITKSSINNPAFLNSFQNYIKEIRFKKIPGNIGDMRFNFPFEFTPG
ncbi:MAG: TonB family protein [Chitinivibrionales bacterium]|nr:TonB family protein [Chitinivibrionales bacterium]